MQEAITIHDTYQEAQLPELGDREAIDADLNLKNYSYTIGAPAITDRGQPKEESGELKKWISLSILPSLHEDIQKVAQMQTEILQ